MRKGAKYAEGQAVLVRDGERDGVEVQVAGTVALPPAGERLFYVVVAPDPSTGQLSEWWVKERDLRPA